MAFSPKLLSFLLLTTLFIISTHARDTQFFSRFTRHPDPATTTNTNAAAEFYNPTTSTNENDEFSTLNKQNEEEIDPTFTLETSGGGGYGFYGHETGLFPPSTTATTTNNNNNNAFETKNYVPKLKGLNEFSNNDDNQKNDKSYYYDGREYKRNGDEGVGYYGGVEKQGMSDTRYLENGRYFYDVNAEKNNNQNNYKGGNYNNYGANYMPYNTNYGGNYKENEYYGGNNNEFYNRIGNNFNGNAMQGEYLQNQKTVNDEFEFDP